VKLVLTLFALVCLSLGLSACGEKEQVVVYKQGKYQGKPDVRPWDNDPLPAEFRRQVDEGRPRGLGRADQDPPARPT